MIHLWRSWMVVGVLTFSYLWSGSSAWGYKRTQTENGIPVVWAQMPVTYYVGRQGTSQSDDGRDIQAVKDAFQVWSGVDCARVSFLFGGLLDNPKLAHNINGGNQNHIFWIQSPNQWPYPSDVLAATKLSWNPTTGELLDADITFNDHAFKWSVESTPTSGHHDVLNTAVHEVGHFLGLDHSSVAPSTMFNGAPEGETQKRDLSTDDRNGICEIYPKEPVTVTWKVLDASDGLTPCASTTPDQDGNQPPNQGCQAHVTTPTSLGFLLPILFCLLLCYGRGRKKHRSEFQVPSSEF